MKTNLIDNRQIRVFISSTFQDMQDERDYLMKRTFPMLRKLAAERDVTLTELDLRWGITEEESKSGKVVEICLREIENSIPFFIGIIGNRYGWVPEKKDISENVTDRFKDVNNYLEHHLSVTEMEMQFGVLQRQEDMHAFFYIKEGEGKEDADNPEMLERLKKEVKASRYPSSTYSSPENLAQQVEKAFSALLDQLFPEGHLSELEKERIGQRAFMNQLCQNYIRDDKNFQVIDEWMSDWDQHQLVITGASGLGKSALIANWLKDKLSDENRDYNIIYHFTGNGGSESSYEYIMKTLVDEINDVYGWEVNDEMNKQLKDKQDDELNDLFIKVASEGKKPLLIVLDAINQIIDTDNAKLLNWLPFPPKNIKILFSTLEDDRTMEAFRSRHYPEFVLQPLDIDRRKQLVTNYLYLYGKKLTDQQVERITTEKQCENTLVLKTLLDELINFGVHEKLNERIEYYLSHDTIEDFYQALLKSYEEDYNIYCEDFVKHVLSLIVLSRNGLSEDEILKATGIKPLYWSQFYCAFSKHLVSKEGHISFAHRFVQEAVFGRYVHCEEAFYELEKVAKQRIEEHQIRLKSHNVYIGSNEDWIQTCRNEIVSVVDDVNTIRYLEEQTFQLNQLGEYVKLHDLLLDYETFRTYYKVHPYELKYYWRILRSLGYSISEYLQIEGRSISDNDKVVFLSDLACFSCEILANYTEALNCFEKALSIVGREHPETAKFLDGIGDIYDIFDLSDEAMNYYQQALEIRLKVLGKYHPETARSLDNIGYVFCRLKGEYNKALEYHKKALEIEKIVLGKEHTDTARSLLYIGNVYESQCKYRKALYYYQQALDIHEKVVGRKHPWTASTYADIGRLYYYLGNYDKELYFYKRAYKIFEIVLGKDHSTTLLYFKDVVSAYQNAGKIEEALLWINKEFANTSYLTVIDTLATVYKDLREYDNALKYYIKALDIRKKLLGKEHPDTAMSYNNIGNIYYYRGDYDKALEYFKQAFDIEEKVLGKEHPDTAISCNYIGNIYYYLGHYTKAAEWYQKAAEKNYKPAHNYNGLAWTYHLMGKYEEALPWAEKAVEAFPNNPDYIDTLASVYQDLGRYDEALEQFELCLKLCKEHNYSEGIQETEAKIAELKELMK